MTTILVDANDSPKLYLQVKDIYGSLLEIPAQDVIDLKYSVYKLNGDERTVVQGFSNVPINKQTCYWETGQEYPSTIKGVSDLSSGYNLVVFPYKIATINNEERWTSPFTEKSSTYEIVVSIEYLMEDPALSETSVYHRQVPVRIQTRN